MRDLWDSLPAAAQDSATALALLLPVLLLGAILLRGYRPFPLVAALLGRFLWVNLVFTALIAVAIGMGIGLVAQERGLRAGMAASADKFDLVIAAPGSEMTMLLATVFLQPSDVPLLGGHVFEAVRTHAHVTLAAPIAFGDSYGEAPIVGTTAEFVTHLTGGALEGRIWQTSGEALIGAAVALAPGDAFEPAHGFGAAAVHHAHGESRLTAIGRMPRTGTPWDRAILVPIETLWQVHGLADGHARPGRLGPPFDPELFPGTPAIIVKADGLPASYALRSEFNRDRETMAFFPGAVLAGLYRVMGDVRAAMSVMALVTQILVAASVLTGLFILSRLFQPHVAMLHAIGAPRRFTLALVWSYAAALLLTGTALGIALGFGAVALLSRIITQRTDILVRAALGWSEIHLALGFLAITALLALGPALLVAGRALRTGAR